MIVDDDRSMVKLLQTLLTLDGFTVSHEARAAEILKAIRAEQPDVVLMDKNLAGADGLELLSQIRADAELYQLPVIIASGEDVAHKCRAAGANGFILKPYSPEQLAEELKKAITH
jgi:two-component system chemotaxis response regulator CheY